MTRVRTSSCYDRIAEVAAVRAGLAEGTPLSAIAEDATARAIRDDLWAVYERQLADTHGYTLEAVKAYWMDPERGAAIHVSGIHRDRRALLAQMRTAQVAAEKATAIVRMAEEGGAGGLKSLLAGGKLLAVQRLFEALTSLPEEAMSGMTPGQIIAACEAIGKLSKGQREEDILDARLADLRKAVKAGVDAAADKTADGKLDRAAIFKALDDAVRGAA